MKFRIEPKIQVSGKGGFIIKALLVLEDGFHLSGESFTGSGEATGEIVFNTSMTGYQEIITDPSYCGQILAMTYPLIGNYGVTDLDNESNSPQIEALLVHEYHDYYSNWRAQSSLKQFLMQYQILGVHGIDTRALTRHIRSAGAMMSILSTNTDSLDQLLFKVQSLPKFAGRDLVKDVSCKQAYSYGTNERYHVVAIDFGIKKSILDMLTAVGCRVTVVPASTKALEIMQYQPDGIFLSNGPGDPGAVPYAVTEVTKLVGKIPIFGICFGHQIIGQALGLKTYKLKFGHRGGNHPVKDLSTDHVEVSVQNHGFCLELPSPSRLRTNHLLAGLEITHINLNDNTVEGLLHSQLKCFSVQHHPEASPGPHDARYLFQRFAELMDKEKE